MTASDNKRIAKNTGILYFRMLLMLGVNLYTSRVIMNVLGVEDFGIYNVVGGVVTMFTFLSGAMGGSTSRFLTFELGKKNFPQSKKIFSAALGIHFVLALVILIVAETIGLWLLTHKLVIPVERIEAAHWAYQFSVLSCMISIIQIPYNASIVANERMNIYAYVSLADVVLRLVIVYLLTLADFDKLQVYAILVFSVSMITASIYRIYCKREFAECSFSFNWDKNLYKTLLSYSGWDLIGNLAVIGMGQGLNLLLNVFFGPAVNAARAIAYQVQGAILGFVSNFLTAVKPQIIKLYAEGSIESMMKLVFSTSKYSFYLLYFLSLPALLETHFLLEFWLKIVPDHTVQFCQLILIYSLIGAMRDPIITSFHATGNIKMVNVISGGILLSILPISYLLLKLGFQPESVFIVTIIVFVATQISELILLKRLIKFSIRAYVKQVILPCLFIVFITSIPTYLLTTVLFPGFMRFILVGATSVIIISSSVFLWGIDSNTKKLVKNKVLVLIHKKHE